VKRFPPEADRNVVAVRAKSRIAGSEMEWQVKPGAKAIDFELKLSAAKMKLDTRLDDKTNEAGGGYFTQVEWLSPAVRRAETSKPSPPNIFERRQFRNDASSRSTSRRFSSLSVVSR
jgi:hypothetical protein